MLSVTDTNAKQTFASSSSINLVPNVYAEWNYNTFFTPATTASSVSSELIASLNPTLDLSNNSNWSSLYSATISSASGRITDVRASATCPQFHIAGNGDSLTSSLVTVSSSSSTGYYKAVLYLKSKTIQTYGTPIAIGSYSGTPVALHSGSPTGTTTWYYRIVTVGADGESYGLDYSGFTDQIGFNNLSSSQVILDIATQADASGYEIYRSNIQNDNNPVYVTTLASTGSIVTFTDNIVTGKNNNNQPSSNFTNKVYVSPQVLLYNNTSLINGNYYIKVFDDNNSENYISSGTALIDPSGWQKVEIWFGSKINNFNKIKFVLNSYADYQGYDFYSDNFQIFPVTEYDYLFNSYYGTDNVFLPVRPGETLLNNLLSSSDKSRYINYGAWNQVKKPCSFYTQNPEVVFQNTYPYTQYLPSIYDNFKYYVSQPGLSSTGIQASYDTYLKVNKIVIKVNKFYSTASGNSLTVSTSSGDSTIITNLTFNDDGTAVIYYNGTSWSQTAWTNPPQLNQNGQIKTYAGTNLFVSIKGIKFQVTGITPNTNNVISESQYSSSETAFEIIEISPRLEVDISPLILSSNVSKEVSQSGDESFPIGYISSNSANLTISNIPIYYNNLPFTIFENDSPEATFYNLMRQGVKFSCFYTSPLGSFSGNIPAGIFYSDSWQINDIDSVSVNAFDQSKYLLMSIPAPQYSATNASLQEIITDILNISGFSDYDYDNLLSVIDSKTTMSYFWCDETVTLFDILQSLLISHQISAFFDEYGMMKFVSLKSIMNKFNSNSFSADFLVADRAETLGGITYSANIIPGSFSETVGPKIGKIIINYKVPNTLYSDYVSDLNAQIGLISKKRNTSKTIWQEETEWVLPCTQISKSMNSYQNYFNFDPAVILKLSNTIGNSRGDVFIGSEIVSYEGLEYTFFPSNNSSLNINKIISVPSDIDKAIKEIKDYITKLGKTFDEIRYYPTGKAVGVMRGKYNTPIKDHNIYDSAAGTANQIDGTVSPSGYFLSSSLSAGGTTTNFSSLGQGAAFTYGNLKMSSTSNNVATLVTPNELSKNYNYFAVQFNSTYRHADQTKAGLFFNVISNSTSQAMFLAFSRYTNDKNKNTLIELFNGSPNGTAQQYISQNGQSTSVKTYNQTINLDLFDGYNHRLSVYISNPYLYIYVDGREIAKIKFYNNLTSLIPNTTSNFGAFVQNISSGTASIKFNEIYACNFPVNNISNNSPDFKYLPRYHFNSETFLNNLIHNTPYSVDHYLWQSKPQVRGIKVYDVKHSLSPAIPNTAFLQKMIYGIVTATNNKTNLILERVDSWNLSYSSLAMTPFRTRFAVVNNHNQLVFLKAPSDQVGNMSILPLNIIANYQFLSSPATIQKVIDKRYANTSAQMSTDWLQGENNAYRILLDSASLLTGFHKEISIQIFGNPLIQLGDFCKFTYVLKRMGTTQSSYYFVKSISHSSGNGFTTNLVLKPMIFS